MDSVAASRSGKPRDESLCTCLKCWEWRCSKETAPNVSCVGLSFWLMNHLHVYPETRRIRNETPRFVEVHRSSGGLFHAWRRQMYSRRAGSVRTETAGAAVRPDPIYRGVCTETKVRRHSCRDRFARQKIDSRWLRAGSGGFDGAVWCDKPQICRVIRSLAANFYTHR